MPGWGEILDELHATATEPGATLDFDGVRRKYLLELSEYTDRSLIVYEAKWMGGGPPDAGINLVDMQAMMEVCRELPGTDLDLILSSPGGSAEATDSIVRYLREQFDHIRVFIPIAAMSAATMWALACDEIVMGKHSQLGPIDPQLMHGQGGIPARAILDQFDRAKKECSATPAALGAWAPILQQYGPALIEQCENAEKLAKRLVRSWLETYMFAGQEGAAKRAKAVADFFGDHRRHQSHSLGISRDEAREKGLAITNLEADQELQDKVLSVHHACMLTLGDTPTFKIVENNLGRGLFAQGGVVQLPAPAQGYQPPPAQAA